MKHAEFGFSRLFPRAVSKILDFLLEEQIYDWSISDISRKAGVAHRTVSREIPRLEKIKIVKITRKVSNTKMYSMNWKSNQVQALKQLHLALTEKKN